MKTHTVTTGGTTYTLTSDNGKALWEAQDLVTRCGIEAFRRSYYARVIDGNAPLVKVTVSQS